MTEDSTAFANNFYFPSPFVLYFLCLFAFLLVMSLLSKRSSIKCCKCWREGVPPTWLVCLGLAIVQLGFGIYPVVVKKFADSKDSKADGLVLSFYRDLCCFPVLFLCALIAERKLMLPSLPMLLLFIIFGLVGMFGNQYLFILGVYNAGPVIASAFQPLIPVFTAAIAMVTCTERPSTPRKLPFWVKILGILLAAGGAIELTLTSHSNQSNDNTTQTQHILGYVFLFGNCICMSIFVLLQKRFIFDKPKNKWREYPVSVTAYSYMFGAVFMGLCSLQYVGSEENRAKFLIPWQSIYVLVYATFVTSALCYLLITWANSQVSSILVTSFWPLQVLVATTFSWVFLDIQFYKFQYIGAGVLILGLFAVLWSNYQEDKDKRGEGGFIGSLLLDCGYCDQMKEDDHKPLLGSVINKNSQSPDPIEQSRESITDIDVSKAINE